MKTLRSRAHCSSPKGKEAVGISDAEDLRSLDENQWQKGGKKH